MSLDFQRMRSVRTVAGRFVGETSIADGRRTRRVAWVVLFTSTAWLGASKKHGWCSARVGTRLHARPSHGVPGGRYPASTA